MAGVAMCLRPRGGGRREGGEGNDQSPQKRGLLPLRAASILLLLAFLYAAPLSRQNGLEHGAARTRVWAPPPIVMQTKGRTRTVAAAGRFGGMRSRTIKSITAAADRTTGSRGGREEDEELTPIFIRIPESVLLRSVPISYVNGRDQIEYLGSNGVAVRTLCGLAAVSALVAFPGSRALLPFLGGEGGGPLDRQALVERANEPAPNALGYGPFENLTRYEDPDRKGLPETVLATWFGVGPSGETATAEKGTMRLKGGSIPHSILSDPAYVKEWKRRFQQVMESDNGRYQLARNMRVFQPAIAKCLNGSFARVKQWNTAHGLLAQVILMDQYARGCGARPMQNQKSVEKICEAICDKGHYAKYEMMELEQALLPLLRSEDAALQMKASRVLKRSSSKFERHSYHFDSMAAFAEGNAKAIEYFGRLPTLNRVLKRNSTKEENAYLQVLAGEVERQNRRESLNRYRKEEAERSSSNEKKLFPDSVKIEGMSAATPATSRL